MNAKAVCSLNLYVLVAVILSPCFIDIITQQQLIVEGFHPFGCGDIARTHLVISTSTLGRKQLSPSAPASSCRKERPRPFYMMILSSSSLSVVDESRGLSGSEDIIATHQNQPFDSTNTTKSAHDSSSRKEEEEKTAHHVLSSPQQQQPKRQQKQVEGTYKNEKFLNDDKYDGYDLVRWVLPEKRKQFNIDAHSIINWAWTAGLMVISVFSTITKMGGLAMLLPGLSRMIRGASIAVAVTEGTAGSNAATTMGLNAAASAVKMNNRSVIGNAAAPNRVGVLVLFIMTITAVMLDSTLAAAVPSGENNSRKRRKQPFSFFESRGECQSSLTLPISKSLRFPWNIIGRRNGRKIWSEKCDPSYSPSRRRAKKIWLEKWDTVGRGGSRYTDSKGLLRSQPKISRAKVVTDIFTVNRLEQGYTILDSIFGTMSRLWMLKGLKRILLHHGSVREIQVVMNESISMAQRKQKEMRRLRRLTPAVTKEFIDDNPLNNALTDIVKDKIVGELMLPTNQFDIHFALIQIQASRIVVATCRGLMKFEPNDDRIQWLEDTASEYEAFRKSVINVILTYIDGKGSAQTGGNDLNVEYYS